MIRFPAGDFSSPQCPILLWGPVGTGLSFSTGKDAEVQSRPSSAEAIPIRLHVVVLDLLIMGKFHFLTAIPCCEANSSSRFGFTHIILSADNIVN
jgi:hypothetical protein